jgi:hypothetical protein
MSYLDLTLQFTGYSVADVSLVLLNVTKPRRHFDRDRQIPVSYEGNLFRAWLEWLGLVSTPAPPPRMHTNF